MGEETAQALEAVKKEKDRVQKKLHAYNVNFPVIEDWLDGFHKECADYIKNTDRQINELANKVSGPVAKATRILHARKSAAFHENNLYRKLSEGQWKNDEDFKERAEDFKNMEYREQMNLVRDIIKASEKRLNTVTNAQDELSDDELGIINSLANHEQSSNWANAKERSDEEDERAAKELMAELEKLQQM